MDGIFFAAVIYLVSGLVAAWMAGALFFDVAHGNRAGWPLVVGWLTVVAATFFFSPQLSYAFLAVLVVFGVFLWWWLSLKPSQDRKWDPDFAQLPRIEFLGDEFTVHNVRNTNYGENGDSETRYESRSYRLSQLCRVDVLILYWGSKIMCHPMFVFEFGSGARLCISIEVRYRVGQVYSFWKSLYRQQELIYIVSDERDAILRRTKGKPGNDLYLFRVFGDQLEIRQFFLEYANRINRLDYTPQWYHGIMANCTTGIYSQGRGRIRWDWRILFNGRLDELLYRRQRLDQSMPFEQLKKRSRINELANQAPADRFGEFIRNQLPGYQRDGSLDDRKGLNMH